MNDTCTRCGSLRPDGCPAGPCPRCSTDEQPGTYATFVDSIATRVPYSVIDALSIGWNSMPRIVLPDSLSGEEPAPVVQSSSAEMPSEGERTSKLHVLGEIAQGGMGAVFKGRDPDLGRELAV